MFKIKRSKLTIALLLTGVMIALISIFFIGRGPTPVEAQAIQELLIKQNEVAIIANCELDGSRFAEVYINDHRGGFIEQRDLELIQFMRQDKSLTIFNVGYLDYRQALFAWQKQAREKRDAILAVMETEGRDYMTPAEEASLRDETGRFIGNGPNCSFLQTSSSEIPVIILSIKIRAGVASVVVDYLAYKAEWILVQKEGKWYIAGGRTLEVTG